MAQDLTPAIILVNPQLGQNIGASARAMLNFGLSDLRIVNPRDGWPNEAAIDNAAHVVASAKIYATLEEAIADVQVVYACSARARYMNKPVLPAGAAAASIRASNAISAIIFGCERSGLSNDDIVLANYIVSIDVNKECSSLNLASAVGIISYEWFNRCIAPTQTNAIDLADQGEVNNFLTQLEAMLTDADFFKEPAKKPGMIRNIRNMIKRITPLTSQDIRTLHGIINALHR